MEAESGERMEDEGLTEINGNMNSALNAGEDVRNGDGSKTPCGQKRTMGRINFCQLLRMSFKMGCNI